jgi:hypothetical protein
MHHASATPHAGGSIGPPPCAILPAIHVLLIYRFLYLICLCFTNQISDLKAFILHSSYLPSCYKTKIQHGGALGQIWTIEYYRWRREENVHTDSIRKSLKKAASLICCFCLCNRNMFSVAQNPYFANENVEIPVKTKSSVDFVRPWWMRTVTEERGERSHDPELPTQLKQWRNTPNPLLRIYNNGAPNY